MVTAHLHEGTLGTKHASAYGFVAIVEGDHVETDGLRHSQDEWKHPDGHDLNDGDQRDAHALHSAPRRHSPVSETQQDTELSPGIWLFMP